MTKVTAVFLNRAVSECGTSLLCCEDHGIEKFTPELRRWRPAAQEVNYFVKFGEPFSACGTVHLGTVPFLITTHAIMKYNLIACKVLIELVLARTIRH